MLNIRNNLRNFKIGDIPSIVDFIFKSNFTKIGRYSAISRSLYLLFD